MTDHDDFGGLHRDLPNLLDRRSALRWMGGMSLAGLLAACRTTNQTTATIEAATNPAPTNSTAASTAPAPQAPTTTQQASPPSTPTSVAAAQPGPEIPDETAGPFPADGTNGPNVLAIEGVTKRDITTSFGDLVGTAAGIPAAFELTIVDADSGTPVPGAVVYLWHCTADGRYSIYEIDDQNYLRGVQVADEAGRLTFESVFPGCYRGRWPHCHFEVYDSLDEATAGSTARKVSQLAFPQADCEVVYADDRYGDSLANLAQLSLQTDGVFRDGWTDQLATVRGSNDTRYTASLLVRV